MNQLINHRRVLSALCEVLFMVTAGAVRGQGKAGPLLAELSQVPPPIIPCKWGKQRQITCLTLPYVSSAPDWGALTGLDRIGGMLGSGFKDYLRGSMVQSVGAQGVLTR